MIQKPNMTAVPIAAMGRLGFDRGTGRRVR